VEPYPYSFICVCGFCRALRFMAQTITDYIAFNGRAIGERRIGTHLQGSDRSQIRVVSGHLPGWLAVIHKQLHNRWCKGQSSILSPVKWKS
jgi:hypothetical protein